MLAGTNKDFKQLFRLTTFSADHFLQQFSGVHSRRNWFLGVT